MEDFEKLGAFYLGKTVDEQQQLVLYDSKDLTTHAVIIGMTGSGKTGLGISLLEEAAIDHIPVIAIDPKGDLGNLLLTFPELQAADFAPWIDPRQAQAKGLSTEEFAAEQADLWRRGLADWGQSPERIHKLRTTVDAAVYTPGSSSGLPISLLSSFAAPPEALREDRDLFGDRIEATVTSLLVLLGQDTDPISSRAHILLSTLLKHFWGAGQGLDLPGLIGAIQQPPMERIGVMGIETFFPAKDRMALAMQLNSLLASPGFSAWLEGEPLAADRLLYTPSGKPRLSILSIAHLSDAERMFFVSLLLGELISWMRAQSGTGSLRAILYMDEIFGYLPPTANPPSKKLFLTLLKQARAFGLGLVLATQNPVDLDYKALSNAGTWFIGRLQTERDKARVMEGLEGASAGGSFDRQQMERTLAGLGKRKFLLHNVHEEAPVVFSTRWVLSYLAGPLTRQQIKELTASKKAASAALSPAVKTIQPSAAPAMQTKPLLPPQVPQYYLPVTRQGPAQARLLYLPRVIGAAEVHFGNARHQVSTDRKFLLQVELEEGPVPLAWDNAEPLQIDLADLAQTPLEAASFNDCPTAATQEKNYASWSKLFKRWLRTDHPLTLYKSPTFRISSEAGETEGEFRIRLQQMASELRDVEAEKLRQKYADKTAALQEKLRQAEQTLEREEEQSRKSKLDTAISFGTALLGAFIGRKRTSATTASRMGTALKGVGRVRKEASDVELAEQNLEVLRRQLEELGATFEQDLASQAAAFDAQAEKLEEILIKPKSTDIHVQFVGLGWAPYWQSNDGRLTAAWS